MQRRTVWWTVVLLIAASGRAHPVDAPPDLRVPRALAGAATDPALEDLGLYLRLRTAAAADDVAGADAAAGRLADSHPESIWTGRAQLDLARLRRRLGDRDGALEGLGRAVAALPESDRLSDVAILQRAELEHEMGRDAAALARAAALRERKPRGLIAARARRLAERIRRRPGREPTPTERLAEADLRLAEGDARGAQAEALAVLAAATTRDTRDHALWIQARAAWSLGMREAAEALCLALATGDAGGYSARALAQAGRWRWNADDDANALRLYRELARRFPNSREAPEALYAIARIHQEAGAYDEALQAYDALAERYPGTSSATDARWRAGWVRYLSGDHAGAADSFRRLAPAAARDLRVAAEYWEARALERLGAPDARAKLTHVAEQHATTFYGMLAAGRLGVAPQPAERPLDPDRPAFPDALVGPHAARARRYGSLGLHRLAQRELDALAPTAPTDALLQAYAAVEAPGPALRIARMSLRPSRRRFLYPLGYWDVVRPLSEARGLDPLLVAALIRQESLFVPDAVSPADAHGLMQLMPGTARELALTEGRPVPDRLALHRVELNVDLGTSLLRKLLDRYDGSRVKALAAYNAGEEAVAKWERRHGSRPDDEFVELISYRETRDYVKAVLTHYEVYRQVYASAGAAPSPSATSRGNPPNAPLDMITMTSPARADSSR